MKLIKSVLLICLLSGPLASTAWAHGHWHGHARFGVFVGPTVAWPYYYPEPYYYYPPTVAVQPSPPVYIEQAQPAPQQYWYFCQNPQGYYPYVKECSSTWQRVLPQPPGPSR